MKLRLFGLSLLAASVALIFSSCMSMPSPGGRGHSGPSGPGFSKPSGPSPSSWAPSPGRFPHP